MPACDFCAATERVKVGDRWTACHACRSASKNAKKGTGLYYDAIERTYCEGKDLRVEAAGDVLVLDLHNVTDMFSPEQFRELVAPLIPRYHVVLLSYVGTTTRTRIDAEAQMREFHAALPMIDGYLCFRRGDTVAPGNKGHFISLVRAGKVTFLDDGADHIASGKAAGARCFLIPKPPQGEAEVVSILQKLAA